MRVLVRPIQTIWEDDVMKRLAVFLLCVVLAGCGTVGGMISGMGQDLQKAGDWMRKK